MKKQKSIKLNFALNSILNLSSIIFPLITFRYVSRILLPIGTGKVAFATSFISYFVLFSQLGIPTYGIRACAKVRDDRIELTKTVHELFVINIFMCVIAYGVLFVFMMFVPRLREERLLYGIVSLTVLFNAIGMEWLYRGLEEYKFITIRSVAFKAIALALLFIFVRGREDYIVYGAISIFAASASNLLNFLHVHKYIETRTIKNYCFKRHYKAIIVFFAMSCATTIYLHIDSVMLGFMKSDEVVGIYDAAVKIKSALVSCVTSLGAVLLPRSSYYVQHGEVAEFKRITSKALHFVVLVASPLVAYFILFAKEGILFLSGPAYLNSIKPMQIIMPTLLVVGISNIFGIQMLVPLGREKVVLYSEVMGAIVDLIINAICIPRFGASGAAFGTLIAEIVVTGTQYHELRGEIAHMFQTISIFKIISAIIIGLLASAWIKALHFGSLVLLLCSACLFFGAYGIVLLVVKEPLVVEIVKSGTDKMKLRLKKER